MWALFLKCMLGAGVVLIISILSKSKAFYIAGLVPLFSNLRFNCPRNCFSTKRSRSITENGFIWPMVIDSLCHLFSCCLCVGNAYVNVVLSRSRNAMLGCGCGRFDLRLAIVSKLN